MAIISNQCETRQPMTCDWSAKSMYFSLLAPYGASKGRADSASFLAAHLFEPRPYAGNLPEHVSQLEGWLLEHQTVVAQQFEVYLAARDRGEPRWYFSSKAHALYFLRALAPTKMVEGAWLYGLTRHWHDARFNSLLNTYLETLGNGIEAMNPVARYRNLLNVSGCDDWRTLDDKFFTQGAVQLALAANTETYLPEVIGFNLGHLQLPLHALITAYELNELHLNTRYVMPETTIGHALTGHAHAAIAAVREAMPALVTQRRDMARVMAGVRLNHAGLQAPEIIRHFDLWGEVVRVLLSKADSSLSLGANRCVIEGKPIQDWLVDPEQVARLLCVMQNTGWIQRHQNPEQSRFWQRVIAEKTPMLGVWSAYERQVLYDWIAGDALRGLANDTGQESPEAAVAAPAFARGKHSNVYDLRSGRPLHAVATGCQTADQNLLSLERYLQGLGQHRMDFLIDWLSPAKHHTPLGLSATRHFKTYVADASV